MMQEYIGKQMKIMLAQLNFTVGDIAGNTQKIQTAISHAAEDLSIDLVIFPELALTGYPPEDLLFQPDFIKVTQQALKTIQNTMPDNITAIIGYPEYDVNYSHTKKIYNSALVLSREKIIVNYRKQCLPNYGVFDEKRYFHPGVTSGLFKLNGVTFALLICEDIWHTQPALDAKALGAECIIVMNASPFTADKYQTRLHLLQKRIADINLPVLYLNHISGQDDLIFDGGSCVFNHSGELCAQANFFKEELLTINLHSLKKIPAIQYSRENQLYDALVFGLKEYVAKNNFTQILVGLSGGIDSALTLAIAADALGRDNIIPVLLPSEYTSELSIKLANLQLNNMGINNNSINLIITNLFKNIIALIPNPSALTSQNLQARLRGLLLMTLSNQTGALLLNTSNKSEIAAGYGTLYGDLCGGYAVLKDIWKTDVYKLAHYRNSLSPANPIFPDEIITRPPTAELAHNQLDTDTLPPYDIVDPILQDYIEHNLSTDAIIKKGFDTKTVHKLIRLLNANEFKRRQTAPGPKVSQRAFTRERRYPITNKF